MTERQQNVAPRAKRPAPKSSTRTAPSRPVTPRATSRVSGPRRRGGIAIGRWLRPTATFVFGVLLLAGYFAAANLDMFALKRVEVVGAMRTEDDVVEKAVRRVTNGRLLDVDLDEVRKAVESERYIASASVVRVLPNTLRVEVKERDPAVVIRLDRRLAWASTDGHVLGDFQPERGEVPPPLAGFDPEATERAASENRDRIAAYLAAREALERDGLWDRLDEVNIKYLQNVKVRLADSGLEVWLGHRDFHTRLSQALEVRDAIVRGDMAVLEKYMVTNDPAELLAAPEAYNVIDASGGKVHFIKEPSGQGARRN